MRSLLKSPMQRIIFIWLLVFVAIPFSGFSQKKLLTYFSLQYYKAVPDLTFRDNLPGMGISIQAYLQSAKKFRATIEFSGAVFLADDAVLRPNNKNFIEVSFMSNVLIGSSYQVSKIFVLNLCGGSSFIEKKVYPTIKPTFGVFTTSKQKCFIGISYTNVFHHFPESGKNFKTLDLRVGFKL